MPDRVSAHSIKGVASPTLHRLILFTERLSQLSRTGQIAVVLAYTAIVVLIWGFALDSIAAGFNIALINLFFTLVDWLSLAELPRRRRSFGSIASGVVLFGGLRCALTVGMALLSSSPIAASTLLLVGHLALTGYVLDSMWGEPFRVGVTHITYRSLKLDAAPRMCILHLTDFHIERLTRREKKVLALIDELRPDLIVYTGDLLSYSYIDDPAAQADCRALMAQLRAPLGVFAVPGTPLVDTDLVLERVLGGLDNIQLLRDGILSLHDYPGLTLIGLSCTHDSAIDGPRLERLVAGLPAGGYKILLYHTPDLMPEAARLGIDLVLCGHTHGGQIRLPLFGALVTSSIYGKRYEMGEYREGNTTMYVSRGIGMEGKGVPRMRFLCEPEIELIELRGMRTAEGRLREKTPSRGAAQPDAPAVKPVLILRPLSATEDRR